MSLRFSKTKKNDLKIVNSQKKNHPIIKLLKRRS